MLALCSLGALWQLFLFYKFVKIILAEISSILENSIDFLALIS
jgi:hypothetical protein